MRRILPLFLAAFGAASVFAENFGNQIANLGSEVVVTFTEDGTFRLPITTRVRVLLVGGGGAGGTRIGGGGGGGGVVDTTVLLEAGDYTVTVGAGGVPTAPVNALGLRGGNGGPSSLAGNEHVAASLDHRPRAGVGFSP